MIGRTNVGGGGDIIDMITLPSYGTTNNNDYDGTYDELIGVPVEHGYVFDRDGFRGTTYADMEKLSIFGESYRYHSTDVYRSGVNTLLRCVPLELEMGVYAPNFNRGLPKSRVQSQIQSVFPKIYELGPDGVYTDKGYRPGNYIVTIQISNRSTWWGSNGCQTFRHHIPVTVTSDSVTITEDKVAYTCEINSYISITDIQEV